MARLAVLDLGTSLRYDQPVLTLVAQRATTTLQAGLAALLLALLIGVPAGVLASRSTSRFVRHGIAAVSILLLSIPALVVALLLAVIATSGGLPSFAVMVISLALPAAALIERLQARALDGVQHERCLDAARARGVPRRVITWRHAWPLSLPAVLGLAGTIAGQLLSGALAVELVTSRSGLGLLTFEALQRARHGSRRRLRRDRRAHRRPGGVLGRCRPGLDGSASRDPRRPGRAARWRCAVTAARVGTLLLVLIGRR